MSNRQLFPHFICRVAGVPVGGLEDLAAVESVASYRALRDARYSGLSLGNRTPSFELAIILSFVQKENTARAGKPKRPLPA